MNLMQDWLWDRKVTVKKARFILKNPRNEHFLSLAALLLARKNTPQEVFKGYLKPLDFLENWNRIKRQMRKDAWNNPRIEFWEAIYQKLKEKYKKRGVTIHKQISIARPQDEFCKSIADKIRQAREEKKLTQSELAGKLKVSQQIISRIEKGRENISLLTLKKIVGGLGAGLRVEISEEKNDA